MALSTTEQLDYLWKKIGYGVTKTDLAANKLAYNEGIASPLLLRADKLWAQAADIPSSKPAATSTIVAIYKDGVGSWSSTVKTTEDLGASDNRTWKTNLTDWIPPEFGATYLVSVYIDSTSATSPQTTGTQLFAAGASSSSNDEWFFDYQSGVLHFIGTNLPTLITTGVTGKSIFISGARYVGKFGISSADQLSATDIIVTSTANIGNLTFSNTTISSITANSNIILDPNGVGNINLLAPVNVTGNVAATYFVGDGSLLTNIATSSISGNLSLDGVSANSIITSAIVSGSMTAVAVTTNTVLDSFTPSTYRTAKYIIKASSDDGYESLEVLLIHDGSDSYITIYGSISTSDADIITVSSNIAGGNIKLYASGTSANTVVNFVGTYVTD